MSVFTPGLAKACEGEIRLCTGNYEGRRDETIESFLTKDRVVQQSEVLCFWYRPPKQEAKLDDLFLKDWRKSSLVQLFLKYLKDSFCVQVLDGLIWYVLCGICSLNKRSSWRV